VGLHSLGIEGVKGFSEVREEVLLEVPGGLRSNMAVINGPEGPRHRLDIQRGKDIFCRIITDEWVQKKYRMLL
jgi:hypothetical protein